MPVYLAAFLAVITILFLLWLYIAVVRKNKISLFEVLSDRDILIPLVIIVLVVAAILLGTYL